MFPVEASERTADTYEPSPLMSLWMGGTVSLASSSIENLGNVCRVLLDPSAQANMYTLLVFIWVFRRGEDVLFLFVLNLQNSLPTQYGPIRSSQVPGGK